MSDKQDAVRHEVDEFGILRPVYDTAGMIWPVQCDWCGHVHDAGKVTVLARYSDCSVWECPHCKVKIDDRPKAWGGRATSLDRR